MAYQIHSQVCCMVARTVIYHLHAIVSNFDVSVMQSCARCSDKSLRIKRFSIVSAINIKKLKYQYCTVWELLETVVSDMLSCIDMSLCILVLFTFPPHFPVPWFITSTDSMVPRLDTYSSVSTNEEPPPSDREISMEIPGYSSPSEMRDSMEESIPMQALGRDESNNNSGRGRPLAEAPQTGERTLKKGPFVYRE